MIAGSEQVESRLFSRHNRVRVRESTGTCVLWNMIRSNPALPSVGDAPAKRTLAG